MKLGQEVKTNRNDWSAIVVGINEGKGTVLLANNLWGFGEVPTKSIKKFDKLCEKRLKSAKGETTSKIKGMSLLTEFPVSLLF